MKFMVKLILPFALCPVLALGQARNKSGNGSVNQNACAQIRKACRKAGFSPGAGLRKNCLQPILQGQTGSGLPQVDPAVVASCRSTSPTAASANSTVSGASGGGTTLSQTAPSANNAVSGVGSGSMTLPQGGKGKRGLRQGRGANGPNVGGGLTPMGDGTVFDSNQNIYWLADANLAGNPQMRQSLAPNLKINPDGTMDYSTAWLWVQALNKKKYLNHNNWQLPVTPAVDNTCSSLGTDNFGIACSGSALGNLYNVGLGEPLPDSVVPDFSATMGVLQDVQPSMYWTLDPHNSGQETFSFLSEVKATNTTPFNYMHVLATLQGAINGQAPASSGVVPYTNGPGAGKAIYDAGALDGGRTWLLDANLARCPQGSGCPYQFGITGTTTIRSKHTKKKFHPPLIDKDGAMLFDTANNPQTGWIAAMNTSGYAGGNNWALPHYNDLQTLFNDLKLSAHDARLVSQGNSGPFQHFQPFFYWACMRDQNGSSQSPCNPNLSPPPSPQQQPMAVSFNFDNGFEGTSETTKPFYVMVYYPAPSPPPTPTPTPRPTPKPPPCHGTAPCQQ